MAFPTPVPAAVALMAQATVLSTNADRYIGQRIFVVRRGDYVYLVPFVEDEQAVFLTIIPSRKATKEYLGEESDDEA